MEARCKHTTAKVAGKEVDGHYGRLWLVSLGAKVGMIKALEMNRQNERISARE
jgi:hypothetical protein